MLIIGVFQSVFEFRAVTVWWVIGAENASQLMKL